MRQGGPICGTVLGFPGLTTSRALARSLPAYHVVTPEEEVEALLATPAVVLSNYDGIFSPLWNANVRHRHMLACLLLSMGLRPFANTHIAAFRYLPGCYGQ